MVFAFGIRWSRGSVYGKFGIEEEDYSVNPALHRIHRLIEFRGRNLSGLDALFPRQQSGGDLSADRTVLHSGAGVMRRTRAA